MAECHIRYECKIFDPRPIWTALRSNALESGRDDPGPIISALRDRAIAIDVRGRILRVAVSDANERITGFLSSVSDKEIKKNTTSSDETLTYGLLASLESVIFESWSLYKILNRFYTGFLRRTGLADKHTSNREFGRLVKQSEEASDPMWSTRLSEIRRFFHYESAPYPQIQFDPDKPSEKRVVIELYPDSDEVLTLPEMDAFLNGLNCLMALCEQDIMARLQNSST